MRVEIAYLHEGLKGFFTVARKVEVKWYISIKLTQTGDGRRWMVDGDDVGEEGGRGDVFCYTRGWLLHRRGSRAHAPPPAVGDVSIRRKG